LPPKDRAQAAQESLVAAGHTDIGGRQGDATHGAGAAGADAELTDFLAPPQSADELGRLGGFRILKILGHGGMGVVFQGEDPKLGRKVAIKAMLPHLAGSKSSQERFLREAKAAATLEHDHIVPILQVGEDRGAPFIVMPFLQGEPLDKYLQREQCPSLAEVLRIGRQTAQGLAAAHKKGLVHRDIKPANIWLEAETERVKILDFGLARAAADTSQLTQSGAIIGTPAYMAPEQGAGKKVDHRCDLFSFGCVLYRMCTGQMPFKGDDAVSTLVAVALEEPKAPVEIDPEVPAALSELVMRLLAKKPQDRPESAQAVVEAIQEIEADAGATAVPRDTKTQKVKSAGKTRTEAGRTQLAGKASKRPPWLWLGIGGAAACGLILAAILIFWQTPHGLVKIESDDPSIEIVFDKSGPTIKGADKEPIRLRAGEHGILVKRGDFSFETDKILIEKGKTITLKFELLPGKIQLVHDGKVIGSTDIPLAKTFTNSLGMEFALVPKGKSWLGGFFGKPGDREVEITHDFYLGKYEVTQEEWEKVTGDSPSFFSRTGRGKEVVKDVSDDDLKRFPVEQVSWDAAQAFVKRLNDRAKETGWVYRLPKEAEWEYACRGGPGDKIDSSFDYYFEKPTKKLLPEQANFGTKRTCKVGSYQPNPLGLFDMHGNVWEWCEDLYDPKDAVKASFRAARGGGWDLTPAHCRASYRIAFRQSNGYGYSGLRIARVPAGKEIVKVVTPGETKPPVGTPLPPAFKNDLGMEFVLVPKGKSWLGGGAGIPGTKEVEIAHDFYLGKYEVTQEEWEKITGTDPSSFKAVAGVAKEDEKRFPVEQVSWEDAQAFIKQVNERVKEAAWVYRLPTEAEWEYACRGGPMKDKSDSAFDFYLAKPANQLLPGQANFDHAKGLKRTCKVGSYPPNRLGLHDMHGNVEEWCADESPGDAKDPKAASERVERGGSWQHDAGHLGAAHRVTLPPTARVRVLGLRLARVPVGKQVVKFPAEKPPVEPKLRPTFKNTLGMEFVLVPKGKSWLGGGAGIPGTKEVEIANDFYLGKYEVTQEEWETVTGSNPSCFSRTGREKEWVKDLSDDDLKRFPVEQVSWEDAQAFIKQVNERVKEAGWVYRLPTDVEWEYACRGGPMKDRSESDSIIIWKSRRTNCCPTRRTSSMARA
jgi:formylglycine-generating enzyme required for sulfatase activity/predicted Ser/Thr protein kinase